ncbi:unnamed protein product [Vicia faba]|uniref:Longin domain-containing protein n=1 Tax=Vicia faba TaxID=3906 RepID=A0AAV1BC77_VICFA|nr:unnamed protein product [Vicia faba]
MGVRLEEAPLILPADSPPSNLPLLPSVFIDSPPLVIDLPPSSLPSKEETPKRKNNQISFSAKLNKFTYNCDGHTFNYLVDNGYTYCVVADESVGRQVPVAFLERVKDDSVAKYGGGKASTAAPNSLNKEFGPKLKEHMQYCVDHPEEVSKLAKVKAQVSEVKGVMMENIEKYLSVLLIQRLHTSPCSPTLSPTPHLL